MAAARARGASKRVLARGRCRAGVPRAAAAAASGAVVKKKYRLVAPWLVAERRLAGGRRRRGPGGRARVTVRRRDRDGDGCGLVLGACAAVSGPCRAEEGGPRRAVLLARAGARGRESDACVSWSRAGESHGRHRESVRWGRSVL